MTFPMGFVAVAVAIALAVGGASGAYINGQRWESKYQAREIELLNDNLQAEAAARKATREIQDAAAAARSHRVRRVLCTSEAGPGMPQGGADAPVGAVPDRHDAGDLGPALREAYILDSAVRAMP